jgi:undecaprenyl-diphosphatase
MAVVGGRTGRRAALTGTVALAIDSMAVNLAGKLSFRRERPDPAEAGVPDARRVEMPSSASFPSGHAASGFAFAEAVAGTAPAAALPLRLLAAVVAYSRVHTGVHYPGDVIVGALVGSSIGEGVALVARGRRSRRTRGFSPTARTIVTGTNRRTFRTVHAAAHRTRTPPTVRATRAR